jgi:methylated-DNA-[protein]-cysteine S-methyltransferase
VKPQFAIFATSLGHCGIAWRGDASEGVIGAQLPAMDIDALRRRMRERFDAAAEAEAALPGAVNQAITGVRRLLAGQTADHRELLAVKLDDRDLPEFERRVLQLTRYIPIGQTRTYGELAAALGDAGAARAVGRAEGHNRFAPIVPCHRVWGAGGAPTGFSAQGGIHTKRRMLLIEARAAGQMAGDQQPLF